MTPAQKCPYCQAVMHRIYERMYDPQSRKQLYVGIGYRCENPGCRHIMQDGV